jgi:hypothetical protein
MQREYDELNEAHESLTRELDIARQRQRWAFFLFDCAIISFCGWERMVNWVRSNFILFLFFDLFERIFYFI